MSVRNTNAPKRSRLSAALFAAMIVPTAGSAFAQETATTTSQSSQSTSTLDKVTVTGSRIKKAEIEGPAPVTVITAEDIEKQGFSTVYDALNTLTEFTGSVQNELNQNGFTPNASFLNLRGLGPGYQLVLVNGRRTADYPLPYNSQSNAVNLANIPAAAIERIEVLSGGASAIYGSDAVAGVVNIIMKSNYEGDMITLRGGTTTRGGGDSGRVQWIGGKTGDNWSVTYAAEYLTREEIFASQRDFMDSYRDDPSVEPENALATIGLRLRNRSIGTGLNAYIYPTGDTPASACGRFSEFELEARGTCGYFGYPATQQIRNSDENLSGYLYGTYDFDGGLQAFVQLSASSAEAKIASATQFWQSGLVYDATRRAILDSQRIFTPSELGGLGAQQTTVDERSFDVSAGLRGTIFNDRFDWEAVVSHARYDLEVKQPRFRANAIREYFLGPNTGLFQGPYPVVNFNVNRFFAPLSGETFRSLITTVNTDAESEVSQGSFTLSGDLFELPAGPLGMAATIEAANQKYDLQNDPRIAPDYTGPDPIYNLTGTGGGGDRDRYAMGVEFSIPVFETFKVNLAGRYDKYDDITDVDGAFTWSAGLEFRPVDSLLIRGSYATSFRAPDMHYVFAKESGFFTTVLDEYRCRRDGLNPAPPAGGANPCGAAAYTYSVFGTRSGSTQLEEEEGRSATLGVVWDVTDNMSISVDAYKIKLEGAVSDISTSYLMREEAACLLGTDRNGNTVDGNSSACQFFTSLVTRTGVDAINDDEIDSYLSFPFNQSMLETSGIDAKWRYQLDTDRLGNFNFGLGWTHVLKLEEEEFPGSGIRNIRDDKQFFNFRSRVNWEVNWEMDDWNVNLNGYRWGSLPNWAETGRIGSYVIWNTQVSKEITDKVTVGFAVNNILDELAPEDDTFNTYPFFWRAYSPIGREVFVSLSYKFN